MANEERKDRGQADVDDETLALQTQFFAKVVDGAKVPLEKALEAKP